LRKRKLGFSIRNADKTGREFSLTIDVMDGTEKKRKVKIQKEGGMRRELERKGETRGYFASSKKKAGTL
jgi:hypothetical protein